MDTLLVELLTEELPPKALERLGKAFAEAIHSGLLDLKLTRSEGCEFFATPRRLAVKIGGVLPMAEDALVDEKIMPVSVALDPEGQPTQALLKKLAAKDIPESEIAGFEIRTDGKAECFYYRNVVKGAVLGEVLESVVEAAVRKLPVPKLMRWGNSEHQFVRPVHGLLMLHGSRIVPGKILGQESGNRTLGHRFLSEGSLTIDAADSYEARLEKTGRVIPSFARRRQIIREKLEAEAYKLDASINRSEGLVDEVTALVEWPAVYCGEFEPEFLEVPQECLILSMQQHQKYFPLLDRNGRLINKFLIVSNMELENPAHVIGGNQRVVRPRLSDARFFYDQDRKKTLASRVEALNKVVYHNKLGSLGERVGRVWTIAQATGLALGGESLSSKAGEAAMLAKADLVTDMVGEFPELQGIMGRYYALHDGHSPEIAFAVEDHYKPRFAGDELPRNETGIAVALADKLESLFGLFSIGQTPTGDKDPFGLRRQALGIIRILIENGITLPLDELLGLAANAFAGIPAAVAGEVNGFLRDRLSGLLREEGYTPQEIDAVLSLEPGVLSEIPERLAAVRAFVSLPEAESLAAANKRVSNILKKAEGEFGEFDPKLLAEPAEIALHERIEAVMPAASKRYLEGDYVASLMALAELKGPVDAFFDNVMVNVEEDSVRANRLALLGRLRDSMNKVADISRLAS